MPFTSSQVRARKSGEPREGRPAVATAAMPSFTAGYFFRWGMKPASLDGGTMFFIRR
jgi:hypothetical protein